MNSEPIKTSRRSTRVAGALLVVGVLLAAQPLAGQSIDMNFFLVIEGPTWGPTQPDVSISDSHCYDQGYAAGFGHLTWHVYLTGSAEDGEEGEVARARIGTGPWYNYYGVMIAEDVAQLHSDANNLWLESAVTVRGETPPEEVQIPVGSQLDGGDFSRAGPFLCFGVPQ
ncbi:MAG: hypothetical protein VYA70_07135 [Gemmatimonadota bacterium]|nr:hypothetical protein [Gemmatimonadota bacterium]